MPTIRLLPDDLASQIAAGEVVERPASIVKELLENALDAQATRILVRMAAGGLSELTVVDDGHGMTADDAELCLARHATSKLTKFSDLEQLETYGFRGEALPSIASVSRLVLTTRTQGEDGATRLSTYQGKVERRELVGAPCGTAVEVRDLFSNVPARLKFLRSTNTEASHVLETFTQVALGRPSVTFVMERDGKQVRHFPRVEGRKARAEQVFSGQDFVAIEGARGPMHVEAYLSLPSSSRQGASGLRLIVNGRAVRDRALAGAIAHAYGESLGRGRYPTGVLYLDVVKSLVDINVHPQKLEVRFSEARAVVEAVHSLVERGVAPRVNAKKSETAAAQPSRDDEPERPALRSETLERAFAGRTRLSAARAGQGARSPADLETRLRPSHPSSADTPVALAESGALLTPVPERRPSHELQRAAPLDVGEPSPASSRLRFLAQLQKSYLLAEGPDGIYVVDQHSTASRALAQKLRRAFHEGTMRAQALLFPVTLALRESEVTAIGAATEELLRLGLDARVRGPELVSLHSLPEPLKHAAPELLLTLATSQLSSGAPASEAILAAIPRVADAFCLKAGEPVSAFSAQGLLNSLDDSTTEGRRGDRRILLRIGFDELERKSHSS